VLSQSAFQATVWISPLKKKTESRRLPLDTRIFKAMLWSQLGAAVQMRENAIVACPQEL
jgi:hypothetical protein